jgi:antitoxin MazE
MENIVKARLVRIGNSRGVRIPRSLLEQTGIGEEIELEAQKDRIVIRSARRPREGWEEQFRRMAERGDDRLLDDVPPSLTRFDDEEWEW